MITAALLATLILQPAPPPGVIAFVGNKNGQVDLFTIKTDGTDLRQLTNDGDWESEPSWSPDGSRIAYLKTRTGAFGYLEPYLYVVWANGTGEKQASSSRTTYESALSWSPDGRQIALNIVNAYDVAPAAVSDLMGGPARVISPSLSDGNFAAWAPNNRIYFMRKRSTNGGPHWHIASAKPDGSDFRIHRSANSDIGFIGTSPDGTKLVAYFRPSLDLQVMRSDGSEPDVVGQMWRDKPVWSRDSQKLVFTEGGERRRLMISIVPRVATPIPGTEGATAPSFSPDGRRLAFANDQGLWVSSITSGSPVKIPSPVGPVPVQTVNSRRFFLAWSPIQEPAPPTNDNPDRQKPSPPAIKPPVRPPVDLPTPPPVTPPAPSFGGFPGTPVGTDRRPAPLGAPKSFGSELAVSLPQTVSIGDGFFAPEPLPVKITRAAGVASAPIRVNLVDPVAGVSVAYKGDENSGSLALTRLSSVPVGEHDLKLEVTDGNVRTPVTIRLIRKPARILLVDDDLSLSSQSDAFYRRMLERGDGKRSLIYDVIGGQQGKSPTLERLAPYDFVIWYIGTNYGGDPDNSAVFSGSDEATIRAFVEQGGGRTLMMIGPGYVNNVSRGKPTSQSNADHWKETDSTFLEKVMGVSGGRGLLVRFTDADLDANGETFSMGKGPLEAQLSPVNPRESLPLIFVEADPDGKGKRKVPVAVWNRLGDAHLIYLGFTLENVTVRQEKLAAMLLGIRVHGMTVP